MRWKRRPEGSNWGDFGPDDQIGRMNLLTPERRLAAFSEVREGRVFTLGLPLDYPGGNGLVPKRHAPMLIPNIMNGRMSDRLPDLIDIYSDDAVLIHTQYSTQWDALAHVGQEFDVNGDGSPVAVYYNGYRADVDIVGADSPRGAGADALDIDNLATAGAQGRAVLIDLKAIYGHDHVAVGYDGLMDAIARQKAEIRTGDFLCLYTGFADLLLEMKKKPDVERLSRSCASLDGDDQRLLDWITESGIVAICADDLSVEHVRSMSEHASCRAGEKHPLLPLHQHCLFKQGIHLGELFYFADIARHLRSERRSAFLITAPPLRLPRGVGSPVTPLGTV